MVPDGGSLVLSSAEAATDPTPFQPVEANSASAQENTIWVPHAPRIVCAMRGAEGGRCLQRVAGTPLAYAPPGTAPMNTLLVGVLQVSFTEIY